MKAWVKPIVGCLAGACLLAAPAVAQHDLPLSVHVLKPGRLYWVEGGGGNSGIIIGDKGVIVVDAKISEEAGRALVAEVAKLTSKPITHLIETHSDGDHVNGAAAFPPSVHIIAHINNRNDQLAIPLEATVEIGGGKCLPPQNRLPDRVLYKDRVAATIDGVRFIFHYFGPAHTNGDVVVELPDERTVFTGDIVTYNVLVHPEKNGSLDGWFKVAGDLLALDANTYVGGHARTPDDKVSLARRIADLGAQRARVDQMVDAGKDIGEVKAAMGDPPKDAIGCRGVPYPSFAWTAYQTRRARAAELK